MRHLVRAAMRRVYPPIGRLENRLSATAARAAAAEAAAAEVAARLARSESATAALAEQLARAEAALEAERSHSAAAIAKVETLREAERQAAAKAAADRPPQIQIERAGRCGTIDPCWFEDFPFVTGDRLSVLSAAAAGQLPVTWGDTCIALAPGHAIRVPPRWETCSFKGFEIPVHLVNLTGAGPETLEPYGRQHIAHYQQYIGLRPEMTILELGCGIGRDAFQLLEFLTASGRYIGVDVTRDSIAWCRRNITERHPNFTFHHVDAFNELYNPHGSGTSMDFRLPAAAGSVDRIILASVFTHVLEDEVRHYLNEFRRVLVPSGLVYANFFMYSAAAIAAAQTMGNTAWKATFANDYGDGVYGNDPTFPRGAVAYTAEAMQRLIDEAGLRLVRPFLKGWWSGLHADPEDGQDAAILALA